MKEFAFTNNEKKKKVLILRQDRIGDLIISSAFLKILRKNLPDTQIDIINQSGQLSN
jgi:ADP-heptose:LPS heptosyltransferase